MELSKLRGYTKALNAAQAEEERRRELAFLDVDVDLGGVRVRQFRPRHFLHLCACGSPYAQGGPIAPEHVVQFLWIVRAPGILPDAQEDFAAHPSIALPAYAAWVKAIGEYIDAAFMDAPPRIVGGMEPVASLWAYLVHQFASAYGWESDRVLDEPFARLYQLGRIQARERDATIPLVNPLSARITSDYALKLNRRQQRAARRSAIRNPPVEAQ